MIKYVSKKLVKISGVFALTSIGLFTEAQPFNWNPVGPIYSAGRMRSMIVDNADASGQTLYVGSTTSGVFKSTNGGVNWLALQSTIENRVVSTLAQASDNSIYVGTGEGYLRNREKLKAQRGSGLYKVVGNSLTLVADTIKTGAVIYKIACSPVDPLKIVIASNLGILVSSNGGSTFSNPSGIPTATDITGQDLKFTSSGILYCSVGNERGDPSPSTSASVFSKIFKSTDASLSNFVDKTPPATGAVTTINYGRIELAIAPSNNNVIYASCAKKFISSNPASSGTKGLFVSYDGGDNWALIMVGSPQLDPLGNGGTLTSGDKAQSILVLPNNPNAILIGSYQLYIWERYNGSNTNPLGYWAKLGSSSQVIPQIYIHENIHDIKQVGTGQIGIGSTAKFYFVTDAGIYRSSDGLASYQPFYQGIVTGQFNTVSIERYPTGTIPSAPNSSVTPYGGFVGGTTNSGLIYFSGNYPNVTQETSFIGGEVNASELSKILPNVSYASSSDGKLWLNSDIKTGTFEQKNVLKNTYNSSGVLTAFEAVTFSNPNFNLSGTPFKLWENLGQVVPTPDSLVFYNDTLRFAASFLSAATLSTQTVFNWQAPRPNKFALIDSVVVRTGTVQLTSGSINSPPFTGNNNQRIHLSTKLGYTVTPASLTNTIPITVPLQTLITAYQGTNVSTVPTSSIATSNNTIVLNQSTLVDNITVTFSTAPFASFTATTIVPGYYRVFCTVYYKYKILDTVKVIDNSISTKTATYNISLNKALTWRDLSNITSTVTSVIQDSVKKRNVAKTPSAYSSRLAFAGALNRIYVSTQPLSLNDPLNFVCVSGDKALTCDALGNKTNSIVTVSGKPTILEWSKRGTELYYATDANNLYRVSFLHTLLDSSSGRNYNGKLHTNIFKFLSSSTSPSINPYCPYRTTLIGSFTKEITSINIAESNTLMVVTLNDPTGIPVLVSNGDITKTNTTNINFTSASGDLVANSGANGAKVNCALIEKTAPYKKVFVGTNIGLFYTSDVTSPASNSSPSWSKSVNTGLPDAQVFDIKQQTMLPWDCYNSGQIYVATNGRGVWSTSDFFTPQIVSVQENTLNNKVETNLTLYPNPTNDELFVAFNAFDSETATINILDVTGKAVLTNYTGKLYSGQVVVPIEVSSLSNGIYFVNVLSTSGVKRVAKLIITK
jgi:hypothetical protein